MRFGNNIETNEILRLYTEENLNNITQKIIDAYKKRQFSFIIGLCNLIDDSLVKRNNTVQKLFSHLILLYHPDRINLYRRQISKLIKNNKTDELKEFAHIISVTNNIDNIKSSLKDEIIDYDIEFEYGYDIEDFDSVLNENDLIKSFDEETENNLDFISILKYKYFGLVEDDLPSFYLEQLEGELNLSNSNLYDLSGLENCLNISSLDLSKNSLNDINQIGYLKNLTELNLSENVIQSVDVLDNLQKLEKCDISFNEIEDVSALFELPNIEYINVIGNTIQKEQIDILKKKNIIFVY